MEKKLLSFNQFLKETTEIGDVTGDSPDPNVINRPETEREARSRIAKGIVQSLFGDIGATGGVDNVIDQTKEVKESLPYRGCGMSEPYKLEKTPLSVMTIKILLSYLQEKKSGEYSRVINELNEKRSVIIGIRNRIATKKESSNQDRFCDALYFIPANSKDGTEISGDSKSVIMSGEKNESVGIIEFIENKILEIESISESGLWSFEYFNDMHKERELLIMSRSLIESGEISSEEFLNLYEDLESLEKALGKTKKKPKTNQTNKDQNKNSVSTAPSNLGDKITPYQITTVPSLAYYGKNPMNPKGVGIKMPGDTVYFLKESSLGNQSPYKMMVEGEKIKVGRYPIGVTKFETYKPAEIYTENCGMQIHRSSTKGEGICVGPWSAGCQVFSDYEEWKDFISKAESQSINGGKFLYGLIQLDDIPEEVLKSAMIGVSYDSKEPVVKLEPDKKEKKSTNKKDIRKVGYSG